MTKGIYEQTTASIIFNSERHKTFLNMKNKTRIHTFTTVIQYSTTSSSQSSQAGKKMKGIPIGKKELKLSLFTNYMIPYIQKIQKTNKKATRANK